MKCFKGSFLILSAILLIALLAGCTDYERAGINPRPFNEPASWELNPYGSNVFQN